MSIYISPAGNPEIWESAPAGYSTPEEWAAAHPVPTPPPPTPEELAVVRRMEILARLAEIDAASVRPLRAIAQGEAVQADRDRLAELDAEAATLRTELAGLQGS
jgi:hypothetical protein